MGGGGGKAPTIQTSGSKPPTYTLSDDGWTSWDEGKTWREDPNTHFTSEGKAYYVEPGEDINQKSSWKEDPLAKWHKNYDPTARDQQQKQQDELNQQMDDLVASQADYLAEVKRQYEDAKAEREAEAQELAEKEAKRLALLQQGRKATILTSGQGTTTAAPTRKTKLGA